MDLSLALTYAEQNDNKALILTDTTTNFNGTTTNLGVGDDMVVGDLYQIVTQAVIDFDVDHGADDNNVATRFVNTGTAATLGAGDELTPVTGTIAEITAMTLDTTVTGVSETASAKTQVDLYLLNTGPFTLQSELVFTVTAALLGDAADSELEDGLYALSYAITYTGTGGSGTKTDTLAVTILVYGKVKVLVYEALRDISTLYMCTDNCPNPEISEADLYGAYLSSIENAAYTAKTEELLDMLVVLNSLVTNGSKITW